MTTIEVNYLDTFVSIMMLAFALAMLVAGIFTAYFGSGKSRAIGGILAVVGLIALLLFLWFTVDDFNFLGEPPVNWDGNLVLTAIVSVIATVVGALIAFGIFLGAIMKS